MEDKLCSKLQKHDLYRSPEHSDNVVLSFTFAFDVEERERYTFALSYPYSFSRIKAIEQRLMTRKPEYVKVEPFAESAVSTPNFFDLQWLPFENWEGPVYEVKVPTSDGYSTIYNGVQSKPPFYQFMI